jgi:hypothetical protein
MILAPKSVRNTVKALHSSFTVYRIVKKSSQCTKQDCKGMSRMHEQEEIKIFWVRKKINRGTNYNIKKKYVSGADKHKKDHKAMRYVAQLL